MLRLVSQVLNLSPDINCSAEEVATAKAFNDESAALLASKKSNVWGVPLGLADEQNIPRVIFCTSYGRRSKITLFRRCDATFP